MQLLSRLFGQNSAPLPSWAALDEEALRLGAALEHIDRRGNLDEFPGTANEKLALLTTANRRGLVRWNRTDSRYELTSLGKRLGIKHAPGEPDPPAAAIPGATVEPKRAAAFSPRALIAAAAGLALGAAAIAFTLGSHNPGGQSREPIPAAEKPPASSQESVTARTQPNEVDHGPPQNSASENIPAPPASPDPAAAQLANAPPPAPGVSSAEQAASTSRAQPTEAAGGRAATNESQTPQTDTARSKPDRDVQAHPAGSRSQGMAAGSETKSAREPAARPKTRERTLHAAPRPVQATAPRHQTAKAPPSKSAAPGTQQAWSSAKTVNVSRTGALVREERRMSDGSVLVRYQYGTGPAHFERRPRRDGDRATGYASGQTGFSRGGRSEWLFR